MELKDLLISCKNKTTVGIENKERGFASMRLKLLMIPAAMLALSIGGAAQQKRSLASVDAAGLQKAIAAQKGKVVFVNMWATWCAPCVAEFPDIVKLYQKYHAKGLEVIAVSFDSDAPTAIPFLDKQKAEFINLLKDPEQDDGAFMKTFEPESIGALPDSWLFDRHGKKQVFVPGRFDPVEFDKRIAELLAHK